MLCAQHPEKEHKRKPKYYTHNNCDGNNLAQLPGKNEFKKKKKRTLCVLALKLFAFPSVGVIYFRS